MVLTIIRIIISISLSALGTLVSLDVLNLDEILLSLLSLSALGTLVSLDVLNLGELLLSLVVWVEMSPL